MTKPYFTYGVSAADRDLITSTTTYNGVHKRYFSSLDAEIFIGEERILDINRIDFSYEEKKLPYYGFNSFNPSRIFVGQRIVQGTFVINFTESGYIAKLLQKIEDKSDLANDYDLVGKACDKDNAPLFANQFDILVGYGGHNISKETSLNSTYLKIQGVAINGYQQILDTSGDPVMEMYSFIAKTIQFDGFKYPEKKEETDTTVDANDDLSANRPWTYRVVEKRVKSNVVELKNRCDKDKKLLGIIVDVSHSLHSKDNKSHIYVDFAEQLNSNSNCRIADTPITLTIADNEVNISRVIQTFKKTDGTTGHYGAILNAQETELVKKKLSTNSQKIVSCVLKYNYILDNKVYSESLTVGMRRGLKY